MSAVGRPAFLDAPPVAGLLTLLAEQGGEARVVGGAVRNWLVGRPIGDIDIATTLEPGEVARRATRAGFKVVPTGIEHGTLTIVVEGTPFEVTTLREDIETDGRHARVRFGRDWRKDAERRDFTINAISIGLDGQLHDLFGGADDLAAGRVRFIGEPAQRIAEDRLRILRFFRFHAGFGRGEPDRPGLSAAIAGRHGLHFLSRERVRVELLKLANLDGAGASLVAMQEAGLLTLVLGGMPLAHHVLRLQAIETALGLAPDPTLRLAAASVLVREDAERLRERLRLSNEEFRRFDGIGHGWAGIDPKRGESAAKALLVAVGPRAYRDRAMVAFARSGAAPSHKDWGALVGLPERWKAPAFPVRGEDLARRGMAPGPELGLVLARVRELWVTAGFPSAGPAVETLIDQALDRER